MPQENVEAVRHIFEAWASGDWSIGNDYLDRHAVFVVSSDCPAFGVYYGLDGIRAYWRDFLEQFERTTFEAKRLQAVGDTVLAHVVQHAKGRASGIEGDVSFFMLFTFLGRKIVRLESVMDKAEALDAVGLTEHAMSSENVEIVRRVYEAAARGDTAAVLAHYDPEITWDASRTSRGEVTGRVVHGHEALLKWLREWYEVWETIDDDLEELIEANDDTVVSIMIQRGRGRASGVEVEDRLATVWTIREGKVVRVVWFPTREEALEAAGLSEQDARADSS